MSSNWGTYRGQPVSSNSCRPATRGDLGWRAEESYSSRLVLSRSSRSSSICRLPGCAPCSRIDLHTAASSRSSAPMPQRPVRSPSHREHLKSQDLGRRFVLVCCIRTGDGGQRSRQRGRRRGQQRRGHHWLATAAEQSRSAGRNHHIGRLRPDDNEAPDHPNRPDDNKAAGHRHRRDDNKAADHRHRPTDNQTADHRHRPTDNQTADHRHRPTDNAHRFDIQAVEACRSARDTAPTGARSARGVRTADPRTAALRRCRRENPQARGCRRCGHDRGNRVARIAFGRKFPRCQVAR